MGALVFALFVAILLTVTHVANVRHARRLRRRHDRDGWIVVEVQRYAGRWVWMQLRPETGDVAFFDRGELLKVNAASELTMARLFSIYSVTMVTLRLANGKSGKFRVSTEVAALLRDSLKPL